MSDKTTISMTMPAKLLKDIDGLAKAQYTTRSEYIRRTMIKELRRLKGEDEELGFLSEELNKDASKAGYRSDSDFERLAQEIRKDRTAANDSRL